MLVFDETQSWSDIVPSETTVALQIAFHQPLELTWEQFTDLANCCKELAERNMDRAARFGSVAIQIRQAEKRKKP